MAKKFQHQSVVQTMASASKVAELTKDGLLELQQELEELNKVKIPEVIQRVAKAREHGDLSENSEYQSARDDQGMIEARMAEIEEVIAKAKIVTSTKSHTKIGVGSKVSLVLEKNKQKKFTYTIVGEFQSDPEDGKVSSVSPLGRAMIGKKINDVVTVQAPAGQIIYLVQKID